MDNLRSFWNDVPALRILLPFGMGIISTIALLHFVNSPTYFIAQFYFIIAGLSIATVSFASIVVWGYFQKNTLRYYRFRFVWGASFMLAFFLLGMLRLFLHTAIFDATHFLQSELKEGSYIVEITQPPIRKAKTTFLKCAFLQNHKNNPTSGYIQVMLPTDSMSANFRYGDVIAFSGAPQLLDEPKNPFEFDYAQFQHFRNIYYRIYLSHEQIKLLKRDTGNRLFANVYALREYFIKILYEHIPTLDERAVAGAILLGFRDDMSNDIVQAYASSGALHVMSVSGLHVGIIFLALQFLLAWMDKYPKLRIPKALILIMGMMLYAILTGLAPSVMRAVVMFSFFVVAKAIKRDANMFNILAVSCLCLLLYNPYLITEVGFKLSYLAVLGIVVLYPIIHKQWVVKNKILSFIWSVTSVSVAAQLATFPIGLYYFHQFPVWFIISNLIVIPISNIIIYIGMVLFAVGKIVWVSKWVGGLLYWLIFYLNKVIYFIEKLPGSLIERIHISQTEMYLLYILMGSLILLYYRPKSKNLLLALLVFCGFAAARANRMIANKNQSLLVVYHIPKHSAVCVIDNQTVVMDIDSTTLSNKSQMLFHILHHWWALGIKKEVKLSSLIDSTRFQSLSFGYFYTVGNKTIVKVNEVFLNPLPNTEFTVDFLILSGNKKVTIAAVASSFKPKKIIFDSTNKPWRVAEWKIACDSLGLSYCDVADYAFVQNLATEKVITAVEKQ